MNGTLVVADIRTYKTAVTDLETVFPESFNMNFSYDYIDNGFFDITLTEQIFTTQAYINDHYNEFLDVDGNVIPLRDGIIINGKTLKEWIDYDPAIISYPRNAGVTCAPLNAGKIFNPVSVDVGTTGLYFKFSLEEIPLDSVVVTFKAGLFYGYYNNKTFTLDKDITYYANVTTNNGPTRIVFSKTPSWVKTHLGVSHVADWGEETASQGGKYHRWLMVTNILRDTTNITQGCPADNYRYMYDNVLMNGKPITYYNAWARGNSKDFTNLADPSTQNPAYELGHPTGSADTQYDLAIRIEVITDQARYFLCFNVPNQLLADLNMVGNPTFTLRDGSAWLSIVDDQSKVVRYDAAEAVDAKIEAIGTVSLSSETAISEARAAYEALSADGKSRVTKLSVLEAAEARLAELKAAKAAAEAVDAKIEAIGTVSLDSEAAINEARAAYNALNEEAKGFVTKLNVLQTAEARLQELKNAKAAAEAVDNQIDSIGVVTLQCEALINTCRNAYEALTADGKAFVTKLDVLVAAEARLAELKANKAAADEVDAKIEAIGTVSLSSEAAISEARAAYEALNEEAKGFVTKLNVLQATETELARLKGLKAEAEAVDALFDAIPNIMRNNYERDKHLVTEARAAYEALSEEAKGYVTKLYLLQGAEGRVRDIEAAIAVDDLITAIGEVTLEKEQQIVAARTAYNALTANQNRFVQALSVLEAAEARLAELKTNKAAAEEAEELIEAIGEVNVLRECREKIEAARTAYDALNEEAKAMVSNYQTLTAAEARFAELLAAAKEDGKTMVDNIYASINLKKYSKDNQAVIAQLVEDAKAAIDEAKDSEAIDAVIQAFEADLADIPVKKVPAKKGCGGSVIATSVVLSTLALAGLGLAISRKRKED